MPKKRHKLENGNVQRREGVTIPEISTGTETESDVEEDFVGAIPASLHSSQLSGQCDTVHIVRLVHCPSSKRTINRRRVDTLC